MKISTVRIENFRSFKDETIEFGDYNCLVGPNGAGKSSVLNALNVFFRESEGSSLDLLTLSAEDFYGKITSTPIRITVTFADLSDEAKTDLKDYVRQDALVVSAVAEWDAGSNSAPVKQYGSRLGIKDFAPFFKAFNDNRPKEELAKHYTQIQANHADIKAAKTKEGMREALRTYEDGHPDKCELLPSEDQFYGVSRGENRLAKYIQWVFVPAVKDAVSEQAEAKNTALGRLLERTVRAKVKFDDRIKQLRQETEQKYQAILDENQSALDGISLSLKAKLNQWSHPGAQLRVLWDKDPLKSVQVQPPFARIEAGEGLFQGELARMGHGLQRSYLLALLHELATLDEATAPRLLLAIEEPELFQHPPQEQYLAEVLQQLSEGNAQLIACTHSPYFVVGKGFEDVRLVRKLKGGGESKVTRTTFQQVSDSLVAATGEDKYKKATGVRAKIHQVLQPAMKEMFFCPVLILVEGLEDVAYITTGLHLAGLWEEWRQLGGHLVPVDGKSRFLQPLAIAQIMGIPVFVVFDADGDVLNPEKQKMHLADNTKTLKLLGDPKHDVFPAANSWQQKFVMWHKNLGQAVKADFQPTDWERWKAETEKLHGEIGDLNKNGLFIADMLAMAWAEGKPSPTLSRLCQVLVEFARQAVT